MSVARDTQQDVEVTEAGPRDKKRDTAVRLALGARAARLGRLPPLVAMSAPTMEIRLGRVDRTYRPGESVSGVLLVSLAGVSGSVAHSGLTLRALGQVRPQSDGGGAIELPFSFVLEAAPGRALAETYHGVYVSVRYSVSAVLARTGFMTRPVEAEVEFVAEVPEASRRPAEPVDFSITPESMQNVKREKVGQLSRFLVRGRLNRTNCSLDAPFTGELTVVESEKPIRSIDLQLVRVETLGAGEAKQTEATEIQNLQVGAGDVARGLAIPLYMIFPRVFTAPTVVTDAFKVQFEVNVNVAFESDYTAISNFPITLCAYSAPAARAARERGRARPTRGAGPCAARQPSRNTCARARNRGASHLPLADHPAAFRRPRRHGGGREGHRVASASGALNEKRRGDIATSRA